MSVTPRCNFGGPLGQLIPTRSLRALWFARLRLLALLRRG
jgi:hypothetical protein